MRGGVFSLEVLDSRPSIITFRVKGKKAEQAFKHESGGHSWQRVPPTEKRGRIHTSLITVTVLPEVPKSKVKILDKDLVWKTCRGSGAGGQHRNVTDSAVQLTHKPSRIQVRCESERSQHHNKETALDILRSKLLSIKNQEIDKNFRNLRNKQSKGSRGYKTRVIRMQEGQVINCNNGKKISSKKYLKGHISGLL